jgi:hypothetical protein
VLNIYCPSAEIVVSAEAKPVMLNRITILNKIFLIKLIIISPCYEGPFIEV